MYRINDKVLYGMHGVCTLIDIQIQSINRNKIEYYVLEPLDQPGARFYIPTKNEAAVAKLKAIPSESELMHLLSSKAAHEDYWIADENQRKLRYKELVSAADTTSLISMLRSIYRQKKHLTASGRKLHLCDENFMRDAKKILLTEISVVLNLSPNDTTAFLNDTLEQY